MPEADALGFTLSDEKCEAVRKVVHDLHRQLMMCEAKLIEIDREQLTEKLRQMFIAVSDIIKALDPIQKECLYIPEREIMLHALSGLRHAELKFMDLLNVCHERANITPTEEKRKSDIL